MIAARVRLRDDGSRFRRMAECPPMTPARSGFLQHASPSMVDWIDIAFGGTRSQAASRLGPAPMKGSR